MHKKALIAGASGFIGRTLANFFSNQGYEVTGIGRQILSSNQTHFSRWICGDLATLALEDTCEGAYDLIIHAAGSGSVQKASASPKIDFTNTLDTTSRLLLYAAQNCPNAKIVVFSSASVYGEVFSTPISEHSVLKPVSIYGLNKVVMEALCARYAEYFGLSVAILRPFSVYGPGLRKQLLWDALNKLDRNEGCFFGTGDEIRDWIHVHDLCTSVLALANSPLNVGADIYNVASGVGSSVKSVIYKLASLFPEAKSVQFSGRMRVGDPSVYVADISKAKSQLRWEPSMSLDAGLRNYFHWYCSISKA